MHRQLDVADLDRNFCNLLNIWDHVFRTHQPEQKNVPVQYGVTRRINANSFLDVYFGEIVFLVKDIWKAPGLKNKLLYIVMPPGWSHTGDHKTAKLVRNEFLKMNEASNAIATMQSQEEIVV